MGRTQPSGPRELSIVLTENKVQAHDCPPCAAKQNQFVTEAQMAALQEVKDSWRGFKPGLWQRDINVRWFIQQNYTPYDGDASFLAGPTERTRRIWKKLEELFVEERKKGVLDVSQIPSSITAHPPGYIDRENEVIVGLQTECAAQTRHHAQWRTAHGAQFRSSPMATNLTRRWSRRSAKYRKTHNEGVFDAYTADIRACRSSHILTGLPDAYGRGRIIGDYRRVPLYGVARLIKQKEQEKAALDAAMSTEDVIRDREELSEQIRALEELQAMAKSYGFDISGPASNAREAVQWLYFAYLAAVKEQNGAAMSLGRTSTFPRHLFRARPGRRHADRVAGAGNHRRLRHQAAHRAFPAHARVRRLVCRRSDLGDGVDRRHGRRRAIAGDEDELPFPAHAAQPGPGTGTKSHHLVFAASAGQFPEIRGQGRHRNQRPAVRERCPDARRLGR